MASKTVMAISLRGNILLSLRRDLPPKSSPTFSVLPSSSVGRVILDLIRRPWVRFPPRSKEFFLYLVWLPDSPVGLSWASHSTLIYPSESILCSTINIFRGIIFRKEFSLFSKVVQATNSPFSVGLSSLTRKMVPRIRP